MLTICNGRFANSVKKGIVFVVIFEDISMEKLLTDIQMSIRDRRFSLGDEKRLQVELAEAFTHSDITFKREIYLDKNNIVDFMIDGLAIEVKIHTKVSAMQIYRQLERYCAFPEVAALMLMTSKAMSLPASISGQIFLSADSSM